MKKTITIYELLGLIKDGKAPNKIRWRNETYYFRYSTNYQNYDYTNDKDYLFSEGIINNTMLNDEAEILDEEEFEDIEELILKDGKVIGNWENGSEYCYTLSAPQTVIIKKINKVIKNQKKIIEKLNKNNNTQ